MPDIKQHDQIYHFIMETFVKRGVVPTSRRLPGSFPCPRKRAKGSSMN
jgi:hypothetical protein